jgi:hypothetical protein
MLNFIKENMMPRKTETIHTIAEEEYKRADHDATAAVDAMLERIVSDDELFKTLTTPMLRNACQLAIYGVMAARRRRSFGGGRPRSKKAAKKAIKARARVIKTRLMQFPLSDGTPLGKATYSQIVNTAQLYLKRATTLGHEGRWLMLVANVMRSQPKQSVGRVLKERDLAKMKDIARAEVTEATAEAAE